MTEEQIRADERERIAKALDAEANVIPCQEDAMVTRSCAASSTMRGSTFFAASITFVP